MATINGISSFPKLGLNNSCSIIRRNFLLSQKFRFQSRSRGFGVICALKPDLIVSRRSKIQEFRLFSSVELGSFVTSDDEISEVFLEAIEELESMTREPSDVLEEMNEKLTARELQLVLVYFSQEGRDSWCALEVFEWLRKENKVDKETMELMVSLMCGWVKKLVKGKSEVGEVIDLLVDMDCVGLRPRFSMIEKVISLYWEANEKEKAVTFVKEVLRRGIAYAKDDKRKNLGGPTGYLAWKMMVIVIIIIIFC